jgi:hypothetical protein
LDVNDKCFIEIIRFNTEQMFGDYHVTGAAYGQKLREPFDDGNNDYFE